MILIVRDPITMTSEFKLGYLFFGSVIEVLRLWNDPKV